MESILLDEAVIRREVARLRTADPTDDERTGIARALAQVQSRQAKAARAITLLDDDAAAPLVEQLALLGKQKAELDEELVRIAARQAAWRQSQALLDRIEGWRARVAHNLRHLTYPLKRDIPTALDVRVTLYPAGHEPRYTIDAAIHTFSERTEAILDAAGVRWFGLDSRMPIDEWTPTIIRAEEFARITHRPIFVLINLMGG